jgi:hypothetical protein
LSPRSRHTAGGARAAVALAILVASAAGAACRELTVEERTVIDEERGYRCVLPHGWRSFDEDARSRAGSLFSVRVYSLDGAASAFVAALPESVVPQLEEWARYYYIVEGEGERTQAKVGGIDALELSYAIRIRQGRPLSRLTYWILRREQLLYVLRATYPAAALEKDEPAVREILSTWEFLDAPISPPPAPSEGAPIDGTSLLEDG